MRLLILSTILVLSIATSASATIGDCGQPRNNGDHPTVVDALHILVASLHGRDCPMSTCDVDADCRITSSDALRTFRSAVRLGDALHCSSECPGDTSPCTESEAPTCGGACPEGYECRAHDREVQVKLCHIPPGNPENKHTIVVAESAVQAHLDHGDYLGRCRDRECGNGERCGGEYLAAESTCHPQQECRCDPREDTTTTTATSTTTTTSTTTSTSSTVSSTTSSTSVSGTSTTTTTSTVPSTTSSTTATSTTTSTL